MTDQRLHDLLHETFSDVTPPDLADTAWRSGRRARRRRTAGAVAGVATVSLLVGGTVWVADRAHDGRSAAPVHQPSPTPDRGVTPYRGAAAADATVAGAQVWWSPTPEQEAGLPDLPSLVPPHIDLTAPAPALSEHPLSQAVAAFALVGDAGLDRLLVVAPDGSLRTVDVARLGMVHRANGYPVLPETQSMLSPTGQYLMFPQDRSVEVLTLRTGRWRSVSTGSLETVDVTWESDDAFFLPQHGPGTRGPAYDVKARHAGVWTLGGLVDTQGLGPVEWYGRLRQGPGLVGQSAFLTSRIPVPSGDVSNGQGVIAQREGANRRPDVLVLRDAGSGRAKAGAPFVGWLDGQTAVYESLGATSRVVGWRVGTHDFGLLSTITGLDAGRLTYVSSWARLWSFQPLG
jgi:hypothetical protein